MPDPCTTLPSAPSTAPDVTVLRIEIAVAPGRPNVSAALGLLAQAPADAPCFYWSDPDGPTIAAYGAVLAVSGHGRDRITDVGRKCAEATVRITMVAAGADDTRPGAGAPTAGAIWLGGLAFDDHVGAEGPWSGFPAAWFVLPEVCLAIWADLAWLMLAGTTGAADLSVRAREAFALLARPTASQPAHGRANSDDADGAVATKAELAEPDPGLRARVTRVIEAIRRGEAEKVVLATSRTVSPAPDLDPLHVLARLEQAQPGCFHYMIAPRPGLAFVGASPERLVRVHGDRLATTALAGSARRHADPAIDGQLGADLLASPKDRAEHALVVNAISTALSDYSVELPSEPRLRRLATIQHLETPVSARLPGQGDVLAEAARLHPTPALGGTPREAALSLIRAHEGIERGWYGGAVGWIDGRGNGDLTVAIRCLLLRDGATTAFAGAGLVATSDPDAEVGEIMLKLDATLPVVQPGRHEAGGDDESRSRFPHPDKEL